MKKGFLLTMFLLAFIFMSAQPTVDGDLSDVDYINLASKQNTNAGFGASTDVTEIVYYSDVMNSVLYIGVKGKLPVITNNGIGLFLNFSNLTGVAAGNPLGFNGAGHYMDGQGGGTNDDFQADFEVDYMFAFNPGNGSTSVFWDAASLVGGTTAEYQGSSDQAGNSAMNGSAGGAIFGQNTVTFAFDNSGGANTGLEIAIPFSELGITAVSTLEAFAFVVSDSGFFSDVTVPGNVATGNPEFNADFNSLSGGPYNGGAVPLPVELTTFSGKITKAGNALNWSTTSELNNSHFEIQRSKAGKEWQAIGKVQGAGTTLETQTYTFVDENPLPGVNYYRLKQVDIDGAFEHSDVIQLIAKTTSVQIFPNPVGEVLNYQFADTPEVERVQLFDVNGKLVRETTAVTGQLSMTDLPKGVYLFVLETAGERVQQRIVKQ